MDTHQGSGDQNATGRSGCLKGDEIDPQGIATPCVTPQPSITQTPPVVTKLPTVGADGFPFFFFALVLWAAATVFCIWLVSKSRKNR